ncbi:MAG: EAL domain-containing protein [Lachnospiraceae bacterium]|nr:EAL domain-containing protein [Lachnospiraceae bacterium]
MSRELIDYLNESALYIGALLVELTCMILNRIINRRSKIQNRIYRFGLALLISNTVCCLIFYLVEDYIAFNKLAVISYRISNYLYYILHNCIGIVLLFYVLYATRNIQRMRVFDRIGMGTAFYVTEILIILNPFTGWVYGYGSDGFYYRNWGAIIAYIAGLIYFFSSYFVLFSRYIIVSRRKKGILIFSACMIITGIVLQLLIPGFEVENLCEAVTFMALMLAIEDDEDSIDPAIGVYNRGAMMRDLSNYLRVKASFYVIGIRFWQFEITERVTGLDESAVMAMVAEYIKWKFPYYMVYHSTPSSFVIVSFCEDTKEIDRIARDISKKMKLGWNFTTPRGETVRLPLKGALAYAKLPDDISKVEDVLLLCESELPSAENGDLFCGEKLSPIYYQAQLVDILRKGIEEKHFILYYQPIYDSLLNIQSAEALVRLNDPTLGVFLPGDFVAIAERRGLIEAIGEYVIHEVCEFLASGAPKKMGFKYITVNLSFSQVMSHGFLRKMREIVTGYSLVRPDMINFEIPQGIAASDYGPVALVIKGLKESGFRVSLEGFGTGTTSSYAVFSLGADMIKMDRTVLWDAMESERDKAMLAQRIGMIHGMGKKVSIIGAESEDHIRLARSLGADFVQGYYLAEPMTREEIASESWKPTYVANQSDAERVTDEG